MPKIRAITERAIMTNEASERLSAMISLECQIFYIF